MKSNDEKIIELKKALHLPGIKPRHTDRIKSMILLLRGETYAAISKYLMISQSSINNYRKIYEKGGIKALLEDCYHGRKNKLTEKQEEILIKLMKKNPCCTLKEVCSLVLKTFHVKFSQPGMGKYLHRLGFTSVKATPVPGKAKKKAK